MSVVPMVPAAKTPPTAEPETSPALRLAAGGTLLAGAVLLLAGRRKAGLAVTAAGTTLALLHEKETTLRWWAALPLVLENSQRFIGKAQQAFEGLNARKEQIKSALGKK